jgi:hypothetical protein
MIASFAEKYYRFWEIYAWVYIIIQMTPFIDAFVIRGFISLP